VRCSKDKKLKLGIFSKPTPLNKGPFLNLTSLPVYTEEVFTNTLLLGLKNFQHFSNEALVDVSDDAYENMKYLNYFYYLTYKNIFTTNLNLAYPISYANVLDSFRTDYEDNFFFSDNYDNIMGSNYN